MPIPKKTTKPTKKKGGATRAAASNKSPAATTKQKSAATRAAASNKSPAATKKRRAKVVLLAGGNPQIAKGDGDAPVQAYIAALPGWKRELAQRLDALIVRSVPNVQKAVKWNSPFYGMKSRGWFLGVHAFTRYLKLAFFRGTDLRPLPPGASKQEHTRYLDLHEGETIDEALLSKWLRQAAKLPGWDPGNREPAR